jgi:hypothetical protein
MFPKISKNLFPMVVLLGAAVSLNAAPVLPHIFGEHMVLQSGMPVPVWGTAAPGEKVEVKFAGQDKTASADASEAGCAHGNFAACRIGRQRGEWFAGDCRCAGGGDVAVLRAVEHGEARWRAARAAADL